MYFRNEQQGLLQESTHTRLGVDPYVPEEEPAEERGETRSDIPCDRTPSERERDLALLSLVQELPLV